MDRLPFFSVIVTTHMRASLLDRALRSLQAQTCQDFEILVIADALDAGTADTCAHLLRPQDTFVKRCGRPGPAESRNLGMQLANGQWILFLDDDDAFHATHLETAFKHIAGHPSAAAAIWFSDCDIITEDRTSTPLTPIATTRLTLQGANVADLHVKNFIPNNTLIFQRSILEGCRVDPHLRSLEDWDFLLATCTRATPAWYPGGGAIVYKDYVNPGTRRGNQDAANNTQAIADFLHVYRRWPAPTAELQVQRQQLLKSVGLELPVDWF